MIEYPSPQLADGVVELRRWEMGDLACVAEACNDPRIPSGTTVPRVYTAAAGRAFVERQWSRADNDEGVSLAIHSVSDRRAVGLVVLMLRPQPGVVGIGYWIVPSARSRGFATRAARLAGAWAAGSGRFARVEAWVEPDNRASCAVLSAAGFEREGRLRSFLVTDRGRADAFVYARVADGGATPPNG